MIATKEIQDAAFQRLIQKLSQPATMAVLKRMKDR
jgi:hypothetical protein